LKSGKNIEITKKPTITPIPIIKNGSRIEVRAFTVASTSVS